MKRFLSVFLFVVLSIFVAPIFSANYSALAGRVQPGYHSEPCDCNVQGSLPCYELDLNNVWQRCDGDFGIGGRSPSPDEKSTKSTTPVDPTSLGLMIFVAAYLFRRFIL
jgi:hypothetical protein